MRLVPEFHHDLFALAIKLKLDSEGLTYAGACARHPYLNKAMLSRACSQHVLSVPSYLALCLAFGLDPQTYLKVSVKQNQAVTAIVTRETVA